jgi:hypothetical protein
MGELVCGFTIRCPVLIQCFLNKLTGISKQLINSHTPPRLRKMIAAAGGIQFSQQGWQHCAIWRHFATNGAGFYIIEII